VFDLNHVGELGVSWLHGQQGTLFDSHAMASGQAPRTSMALPGQADLSSKASRSLLHTSGSLHPRRPPAHRSVSLLHSPKTKTSAKDSSASSSDSGGLDKACGGVGAGQSPGSLHPFGKHSSGESSNAEKWFEKSNNEVGENTTSFVDNEPPFYMRNSSSSETPPERQKPLKRYLSNNDRAGSLPLHTGLIRLGTDGSSTEDFRSVIDDLTIENKKLKRRLKQYEKLHDAHLNDEKLFEVRVHGLPTEKKRELEEMLRKFAIGLQSEFPQNGYQDLLPLLQGRKTTSSQTSLHNTDSAYASASASGQGGSSGPSVPLHDSIYKGHRPSNASLRQNIHSFLHHIPEGLLPQNPATMSERAKKKLVVGRLEQIFAGKDANSAAIQQPMQQQEVSQMAARADRSALEAQGQRALREGNREATIMFHESDDSKQGSPNADVTQANVAGKATEQAFTIEPNNSSSGEQRPTRPLDLDPHRAQVPSENIEYMRHLGFSPPDPGTQPEEGHGWLYLNLLVNMAQLHTINVTVDFVRKALSECSNNFELSADGRKVRWKGEHPKMTSQSSSSEGILNYRASTDCTNGQSPRKRLKLSKKKGTNFRLVNGIRTLGEATQRSQNSRHAYTPMFFHKDSTDDTGGSSDDDDESSPSPFPVPIAGDSSGMTNSGMPTTSARKSKSSSNGPIIFYNNARFCTDLSGESRPDGNPSAPSYSKIGIQPVGKSHVTEESGDEARGPLAQASELPEPMEISDNPIPESMELCFPPNTPPKPNTSKCSSPIDLKVTGIGGVWPADHFAISVKSRHALINQHATTKMSDQAEKKSLPSKFKQILQDSGTRNKRCSAIHKQVVSTSRQDLPPSQLPPALSYMEFGEESSEADSSEIDGDLFMSPEESPGALPPSAAPQAIDLHYIDSDEDEASDNSDADESDSSLDLLAAARALDPVAVRTKEREYDAEIAERLAEEIPAGSSAATAGGGSGFPSPASDEIGENGHGHTEEATHVAHRPELKRTWTSDSMQVQSKDSSYASSGEDDNERDEISEVSIVAIT